ncbi:chorismate mutase [Leptotrichia wadei]|uniref:Bifunctional chorismate mutase/prephenate dehydratase n=1 Tax=Leptotrichia wadei TaxID=157687 RepID=A0A510KVL0_9FUSO|nr:chorismate mutase [Leptotrichia wadei]BBM55297.1 chorismate mutase [Leptotrichia wadei]
MNTNKNLDLGKIREKIDKLDSQLVELLEKRLEIVQEVAQFKKQTGKRIFDEEREKEVVQKNLKRVKNKELNHYIELILKDIMDSSKEYQKFKIGISTKYVNDLDLKDKKLGYTGVPGSYAYEVLMNILKNNKNLDVDSIEENKNIFHFNSHKELVEAVHTKKIDIGILPIENSIVGEVRDSIDLINTKNIHIIGEVRHKISHNLLGVKRSRIEDIRNIYSHDQAFMQCSQFLSKHEWHLNRMTNTAISGKYIAAEGKKENACIANMKTKEVYGLELLKKNINNEEENYTRFFIISNEEAVIDGSDKISIVTSANNESGALIGLLQIFYKYGLNMVNLKSRPRANKPWEYYFYIDFEGNMSSEKVRMALEEMREKSNYLQILGNYKLYNLEIYSN